MLKSTKFQRRKNTKPKSFPLLLQSCHLCPLCPGAQAENLWLMSGWRFSTSSLELCQHSSSQKHPLRFSQLTSPALPSPESQHCEQYRQSCPALAEQHTLCSYFHQQLHCRLRAELCGAGAQQRTWGPVAQPGDTRTQHELTTPRLTQAFSAVRL